MIKSTKVLLFFIASTTPTASELAAAEKLEGYSVRFRNRSLIERTDRPEKCHAVAGLVPSQYANLENVKVFDTVEDDDDESTSKPLSKHTKDELIALLTEASVEVPPGLNKAELVQLAADNGLGEA